MMAFLGRTQVTSRENDLLNGVIIHIEHIDRDKEANKEIVEPYRLPAIKNVVNIYRKKYSSLQKIVVKNI